LKFSDADYSYSFSFDNLSHMAAPPANSIRELLNDTQPLAEFRRTSEKIEAEEAARTGAMPMLLSQHTQEKCMCVIDWGQSDPNGNDVLVNLTGLAGLPTPQIRVLYIMFSWRYDKALT
jgi:hypothetical protein